MIAEVAVKRNLISDQAFDYICDDTVKPLSFVEVPFGKQIATGIVLKTKPRSRQAKKKIIRVLSNGPVFNGLQVELAAKISQYCFASFPDTLNNFLPPLNKRDLKTIGSNIKPVRFKTTAGACFIGDFSSRIEFFCQNARAEGQNVLILPTILKAQKALNKIRQIMPERAAYIWHSFLSSDQKAATWQKILSGEKVIIVGTRQAMFLPFSHLAAVQIDNPANLSYREDQSPYYNSYSVARTLTKISNARLIVSADCPDLLTYAAILKGTLELKEIKSKTRYQLFDSWKKAQENLQFLNKVTQFLSAGKRVAFVSYFKEFQKIICRECQQTVACTCQAVEFDENSKCHKCQKPAPTRCSQCKSEKIYASGITYKNFVHTLKELFPSAAKSIATNLKNFSGQQIVILSPYELSLMEENIDLVIFPFFSRMIDFPSFSNQSHIFQLIMSTKSTGASEIMIFVNEEDDFIYNIVDENWRKFFHNELRERKASLLPPYTKAIEVWTKNANCQNARRKLENFLVPVQSTIVNQIDLEPECEKNVFTVKKIIFVKNNLSHLPLKKRPQNIKLRVDPIEYM